MINNNNMNIVLLNTSLQGDYKYLVFFGLMFIVMYFFMLRPQINRQKQEEKFRNELKKGDKVITIGGLHGKIISLNKNKILIENNGVKLEVERSAISANIHART